MKFSLLALASLSLANAGVSDSLRRRLSFEKIAGYSPGTQVTDHCAIDLDQNLIEIELSKQTDSSFQAAEQIYNQGGSSKSYAELTLNNPLFSTVEEGTLIQGEASNGLDVNGKAYGTYVQGSTVIRMSYQTSDDQDNHVGCMVGGLPLSNQKTDGCLANVGTISVGATNYSYEYDPTTQNKNGRTIAGFSEVAGEKMRLTCDGCPYKDHQYFYEYYGIDDYGHQWVTAALNGKETSFVRGNADFSVYGYDGKVEAAKKGMLFFNIFMYVIREFEDALDDCDRDCEVEDCNDDVVHSWDEGVCFYTGSIEGQDGVTKDGKLLHQLADKRCHDFKTCGKNGDENEGNAKLNSDLFDLFALGNFQLQGKKCDEARGTVSEITRLMYIPFIQGTLRYAYRVGELNGDGGEKSAAEGAVFAAAILPRVYAANQDAAEVIYENMKVGANKTNFVEVKKALESVYGDLGLKCSDVGGLWNDGINDYWEGGEPCGPIGDMDDEDLLIVSVVAALGGIIFVSILAACFVRNAAGGSTTVAAKQPDLQPTTDAELS
ncbi:unnamed protein product [Cylindrotheca closterium]|uniref:Uncharacterized protein n=1 Tax=Cylindrotheca closterium TaxID=2856 RepID=A0AAD2JGU1_9STRA|nr:unnamed protein product [Cylindrotheca closterium]